MYVPRCACSWFSSAFLASFGRSKLGVYLIRSLYICNATASATIRSLDARIFVDATRDGSRTLLCSGSGNMVRVVCKYSYILHTLKSRGACPSSRRSARKNGVEAVPRISAEHCATCVCVCRASYVAPFSARYGVCDRRKGKRHAYAQTKNEVWLTALVYQHKYHKCRVIIIKVDGGNKW